MDLTIPDPEQILTCRPGLPLERSRSCLACQPANHRSGPDGSSSFQVFVLDIDRRPTLAFEADGLAAAQEICRDADLRGDLTAMGFPLCGPNSTLSARAAAQEEIAAFRHSVERTPASSHPTMTFPIKIDGVVTVGPERD